MPIININMQWLISLATAAWGVWTWAADREREREKERLRISALYINPFLTACDAKSLAGCNRLAEVQNHLVDLLNYVEGKAGYSVFHGKRNKCQKLTPFAAFH